MTFPRSRDPEALRAELVASGALRPAGSATSDTPSASGERAPPPEHEAADPVLGFEAFADRVRSRLEAGRAAYGSATFDRSLPEIADELGAELLDQAAYAFIGWTRLQALRGRLGELEARASSSEEASSPKMPERATGRLVGAERGAP